MIANLALSKGIIGKKKYYLVIDDTFYLKISKRRYYELADWLRIKVD